MAVATVLGVWPVLGVSVSSASSVYTDLLGLLEKVQTNNTQIPTGFLA